MSTAILQRERVTTMQEQKALVALEQQRRELPDVDKGDSPFTFAGVELAGLRSNTEKRLALKQTLIDLDIQPFTGRSVQKYMQKMAFKHTPWRTYLLVFAEWFMLGSVLISTVLTMVIGMACAVVFACGSIPTWLMHAAWIAAATAGAATVIGAAFLWLIGDVIVRRAYWHEQPWYEYEGQIPEFVTQTMDELRERCRGVSFFIAALKLKDQILDPFLIVELDGQQYYVEVWNGPGLSKKREV